MNEIEKVVRTVLRRAIGYVLLTSGFFMLFSAVMWVALEEREMWFSRAVAGLAFLGLWYIGSRDDV